MHLAEGVLPLGQAIAWSALAAPALLWSLRGEQQARRNMPSSPVIMAGVTSLLFAATLMPLPVPVVGATSHICLTPALALIVGVRRIVWPTFFVLLLQAVFFAHGGLTTLGVNTLTLGLLGPLTTVGLWALCRRLGAGGVFGLAFACGTGGLSVYVADAAVLAVALSDAMAPLTTFGAVLLGFAPVQTPLAMLEAVASVGIVRLLAKRRAELLPASLQTLRAIPVRSTGVMALLLAIGLSGCSYEGIDGTVFGAAAQQAGRAPVESIVDLSQGELGLALSILILFGLGFIAGRCWERLFGGRRDALPR
ncbi:MAG: energy-coupling factor ABC transporter permease [Gammaproteobacteria bacterium]|nr:energy-coupling factor ABC transporter permease [Gammaproteobacteria bacterium]MCY4283078.1 energy-coupling factor ABC transporter permease [Gammaproteobacteria bacterium]MCY4337710.1 energy-coupling factor ABC transporter permease [Gammaproteobacteria bacterium]